MPIYEYKCENGHVFDVMQRMSDDPLETCTECEAAVRKIMQPIGISFRGSGFYSTDYSGTSKTTPPGESNASKNGDSSNGDSASSSSPDSSSNGSSESSKPKDKAPTTSSSSSSSSGSKE